jgi:hypothetical protein
MGRLVSPTSFLDEDNGNGEFSSKTIHGSS